ncbi:MAG: S9 family peptidase [Spirochaetaceae bacterium]|nr:MAG: S9 family peptidase [Spirochaetaceae bacterium]
MSTFTYPHAARGTQTDRYHGRDVSDPYRALEDADSLTTQAWIARQNELTGSIIGAWTHRHEIHERLERLWNFARAGLPVYRDGAYIRSRNSGLQNQDVIYHADRANELGRILLDPNTLSEDGTVSLSGFVPSPDGQLLAYGIHDAGSDWIDFRVRSIEDATDLPETLRWSKFCQPVWLPDSSGFVYLRYREPENARTDSNTAPELALHRIGTQQADDETLFNMPDHPDRLFSAAVSDDETTLVITVMEGSADRHQVYLRSLDTGKITALVNRFEAEFEFLGNDSGYYYFLTTFKAERGRIVCIDTSKPDLRDGIPAMTEIIAEASDTLLEARLFGDDIVMVYLHHAQSRLVKRPLLESGEPEEIALPGIGTISGILGERGDPEFFYQYTSFLQPAVNFRYRISDGSTAILDAAEVAFDANAFTTTQIFAQGTDGTEVPLFVVHRKDLEPDGSHPTLLYGYGGFNVAMRPFFTVSRAAWLEQGGVLAVACLRGGGEYGSEWHAAGTKLRKQNVFDDFVACAERLIADGYTSRAHLAIQGGSNGGLLVGACITQRPDLFAAAHAAVGVLDMLRYHTFTIGWAWTGDFGSSENPEEFEALYAYSPLHNVVEGECYPATLLTTGDHDDRVVPGHTFKFAAALQYAQGCTNPILLRVETRTGHGAGKPTSILIEEHADILSFLWEHT